MLRLAFVCLLALSKPLWADSPDPPLPALYGVVGVAADDVLNIRASPTSEADVIGALDPAAAVEVVALSREGRWGLVNFNEASGWVAMRYLAPQVEGAMGQNVAARLNCFGTEPFWTITGFNLETLRLHTPDGSTIHSQSRPLMDADLNGAADFGLRLTWQANNGPVSAYILPGLCSDGMSDRTFGLHYVADNGPRKGCCSIN